MGPAFDCGENIGQTVEGLQRFPINMGYPRELRDSVKKRELLPIVTNAGATTTLAAVADFVVTDVRHSSAAEMHASMAESTSIPMDETEGTMSRKRSSSWHGA